MTNSSTTTLFSPGTRVVLLRNTLSEAGVMIRRGSVGVVKAVPESESGIYLLQLPSEETLRADASLLTTLVKFRDHSTGLTDDSDSDLFESVVFQCVIGSRAYGLENEESDIDRRGFFLPPADVHWSLKGVPEQITCDETQEQYWEIQKFITLALKANPNVLECLYSPIVERSTPLVDELLQMRSLFLSKLMYQTYNGYVMSQFKKLQAGMHKHGQAKPKHVMHLIRLLLSGIHTLKTGHLSVRVENEKDRLMAIRENRFSWEDIDAWRKQLHQEFDQAYTETQLPDQPNHEAANAFLLKARRFAASQLGEAD